MISGLTQWLARQLQVPHIGHFGKAGPPAVVPEEALPQRGLFSRTIEQLQQDQAN